MFTTELCFYKLFLMHLYIIQIAGGEINNNSLKANLLNNEVPLFCSAENNSAGES